MSMTLLREISRCEGPIYVTSPMEVGWLLVYQSNGWIDVDFERPLKTAMRHHPPIHAVVHGLTSEGKEALKETLALDSFWDAEPSSGMPILTHIEIQGGYPAIPTGVGA